MRFLVPLVAALVPLVITPGLLSYFDVTPKIAILLFGVALILLYSPANLRNVKAVLESRRGQLFVVLVTAQWFSFALATALSTNRWLSLNGGNWRRFGLMTETCLILYVVCAAAWMAASERNVLALLRACTASGGLSALYGIAQYFGWDPLLPAQSYQVGEGVFTIVRPPGTLGHADYFAAWLVAIVFLAIELGRRETNKWLKLASRGVGALATVAIVLSGTRAALVGLIAGAIVFAILRGVRLQARAVIIAIVSAVLLIGFFVSPAGTKLRARLQWARDDARGGARLLLWRDSLSMAVQRPFAGFGPETFGTEFPRFESIELARAYPDFYHESPHNLFLDAQASQGVLGLLILLGLCGLALWSPRKAPPALIGGFVALLACQQFAVLIVPTALYFYLLIALLVIPSNVPIEQEASWRVHALRIACIAAGSLLTIFTVRIVVADRALAEARNEAASGNAIGATQYYGVLLRWQPAGAGSDLVYSREMAALASRASVFATRFLASQQALNAGVRATMTAEDRQNAWYNLAEIFATTNNPGNVERALRNAIAWAPGWFKPHWTLAQLLELYGHHEEALTEARAAVERDGGRDPEVTETLHKIEQQPKSDR